MKALFCVLYCIGPWLYCLMMFPWSLVTCSSPGAAETWQGLRIGEFRCVLVSCVPLSDLSEKKFMFEALQ